MFGSIGAPPRRPKPPYCANTSPTATATKIAAATARLKPRAPAVIFPSLDRESLRSSFLRGAIPNRLRLQREIRQQLLHLRRVLGLGHRRPPQLQTRDFLFERVLLLDELLRVGIGQVGVQRGVAASRSEEERRREPSVVAVLERGVLGQDERLLLIILLHLRRRVLERLCD